MTLYHVSPLKNLESILAEGLIIGSDNTSSYENLEQIHLTNDYMDLLQSGVYPEIYDHGEVVVFEVNGLNKDLLMDDPEFDDEDFCFVYSEDIDASKLTVHRKMKLSEWHATTPMFVDL